LNPLKISGEILIAFACSAVDPVRQCNDIGAERFILECRCKTAGAGNGAIAGVPGVSQTALIRRFGGRNTTARRSVAPGVSFRLEIILSSDSEESFQPDVSPIKIFLDGSPR
jgi:hypothetical protein